MKRMPTNTSAIHWHFKLNEIDYIAAIADCRRAGWFTSVYTGTKSGHILNWSPIVTMPGKDVAISISEFFQRSHIEYNIDELKAEIEKSNVKFQEKIQRKYEQR